MSNGELGTVCDDGIMANHNQYIPQRFKAAHAATLPRQGRP